MCVCVCVCVREREREREKGEEEGRVQTLGEHWGSWVRYMPNSKETMSREDTGLSTETVGSSKLS